MDKVTKILTTDDIAWVSSKLIMEYQSAQYIKEADKRNTEISTLVYRALRFGLEELVSKFGYLIMDIPLSGKRFARLVIPNDVTEGDIGIIMHYLEMLSIDKNDAVSDTTGNNQGGDAGSQIPHTGDKE